MDNSELARQLKRLSTRMKNMNNTLMMERPKMASALIDNMFDTIEYIDRLRIRLLRDPDQGDKNE
jgi:hypothetical protein